MKYCIVGAADTIACGKESFEIAKSIGRYIAKNNGVLLMGAGPGFPLAAAMGAKEKNGVVIGFSPAGSEREHVEAFRLPLDYMDVIVYTGFGYPGRDILMTRASDAVIIGCGRIGTIHNFTVAFEDEKPIGVLQGDWETDDTIKDIIEKGHRKADYIVFDSDYEKLITEVTKIASKNKVSEYKLRKDEA